MRQRFVRLVELVQLLAAESLAEAAEVHGLGPGQAPLTTSRLTRGEMRKVLSLRTDFNRGELDKMFSV